MTHRIALPTLVTFALLLAACGGPEAESASPRPQEAAAPLPAGEAAYAVAEDTAIEEVEPQGWPDLHNVFVLSDDIVSGSEPHGDDALKRIAETWGVKTILSVDGKAPDAETAKRYGMRYVHVPIQYSGITAPERMRIAKVFREMEGPFFVHCFHGKHRGPAAAALGRVVRDGASREEAVAEMRRCGTSSKYAGLYETIARGEVPPTADSASYDWDFPAAHEFKGFRQAMIEATRVGDHLKAMAKRDWVADPTHPDLHSGNEAAKLVDVFEKAVALEDVQDRPADFKAWLQESLDHARALDAALRDEPVRTDAAKEALDQVQARCAVCHKTYRNN